MRLSASSAILLVSAALLAASGTGAADRRPDPRFDASSGVIEGKVALGIWPESGSQHSPADPTGLKVTLVPVTNPDRQLVYPAGSWFVPPLGQYRYWLEGGWEIMPAVGVVRYAGEAFEGLGFSITAPLVPAGRLRLAGDVSSPGPVVRCLHETSQIRAVDAWASEMARWVRRSTALEEGFLMPAGRVAVGIYSPDTEQYSALAVPIEVAQGKVQSVRPRPPLENTGDLLLELRRFTPRVDEDDIRLAVKTVDGARHEPVFRSPNSRRIVAIWTALPAGRLVLELTSARWSTARVDLELGSGKVLRRTIALTDARPDPRMPFPPSP